MGRGHAPSRRQWKDRRKRATKGGRCPICEEERPFLWTCRCGFRMCQECMLENAWGMTCNNITWVCPDCGEGRSF